MSVVSVVMNPNSVTLPISILGQAVHGKIHHELAIKLRIHLYQLPSGSFQLLFGRQCLHVINPLPAGSGVQKELAGTQTRGGLQAWYWFA